MPFQCFAIAAPGLEGIMAAELARLGATIQGTEPGGVAFAADRRLLYAANLELRTASRILVRVAEFPARAFYELERKAKRVRWGEFIAAGTPVRFRVTSKKSRLYHADGIAQRLLESAAGAGAVPGPPAGPPGERSGGADGASGDESGDGGGRSGEQLFVVRVHRDVVTLSADSSGDLLHRRGYRLEGGEAPLRETLAAAMLLAVGYDGRRPLLDPFAGSGTIPIEAALIARRIAPGSTRHFAFERWPSSDAKLLRSLREAAADRALPRAPAEIGGADREADAVRLAGANAERAGVARDIRFERTALSSLAPPPNPGFLVTNPPYGVRLGDPTRLRNLYARLGEVVRNRLSGWTVAFLSADAGLERRTGLPLTILWRSVNGGIKVRLVATMPREGDPNKLRNTRGGDGT